MFNIITGFGFAGLFMFALATVYLAYVGFMYIVYRMTNGKMKFKEYIKYW